MNLTAVTHIKDWLGRVTASKDVGEGVLAFNVGLFQSERGYCAYLVGSKRFSEVDHDWACEEAYTPEERYLELTACPGESWEAVLALTLRAAKEFIAENPLSFLAKAKAVTVGFDDGDLTRIC